MWKIFDSGQNGILCLSVCKEHSLGELGSFCQLSYTCLRSGEDKRKHFLGLAVFLVGGLELFVSKSYVLKSIHSITFSLSLG